MSCVSHAFASVHCCLVVTCRERADLLALVCGVYCDFVSFPFRILGQVCYLIASIPDHCYLSNLKTYDEHKLLQMVCISCPLSSDCSATSAGTLAVSVCFDKNTMHKHIHDKSIVFMMTYK